MELTVKAIVNFLTSLFILSRERFKPHCISQGPTSCNGAAHPSGWTTATIFQKFIEHFHKHVPRLQRARFYFCISYWQTVIRKQFNPKCICIWNSAIDKHRGIYVELAPGQKSLPSTSGTPIPRTPEGCNILPVTSEQVRPYLKAESRNNTKTGRKKVKSSILTDTAVEEALSAEEVKSEIKRMK